MQDFEQSLGIDGNGNNIALTGDDISQIKEQLLKFGKSNLRQDPAIERAPVDLRIENFLNEFLADAGVDQSNWLPNSSFICAKHGVSRILSLPEHGDEFHSEYVDSYRIYQGILNNPSTDKRTTAGAFHIVEGGLPVPRDKKEIPKLAFANMLKVAFNPPNDMLILPFSSKSEGKIKLFVSAYFKPVICPEVKGCIAKKNMEIRMFLPGSLVSILDCTESIFGNAGSPFLSENDAAMDPETWSGHTGCIVFAPQLRKITKKSLGLPHISEASERQKYDGMCWEHEGDIYHDGRPFRVVARTGGGVIVSIVADSYNGYGKKEIKTHISYATNMYGLCEEEHSGGALVFPRYDLGDEFNHDKFLKTETSFDHLVKLNGAHIDLKIEGYAIDKNYSEIIYLPGNATFNLPKLQVSWQYGGKEQNLLIELGKIYILPNGYRVHIERPSYDGARWKMIGTRPDAIFCYKPATVSGGGKSEIAKPLSDAIIHGPMIVSDISKDFEFVDKILHHDFSHRFFDKSTVDTRGILDNTRTLGSIIKLMNFNQGYADEHNNWLKTIPAHIKELIFIIKAFYKESWGEDWQKYFSVDIINGVHGNELKYKNDKLVKQYVRVGYTADKNWRNFSLRDDFHPAFKLQLADDISSTVTLPSGNIVGLNFEYKNPSVKFVHNCEYRLYQRPDEAVVPGYDHETEYEMSKPNTFTCNYKPLTRGDIREMMENRIRFEKYTQPMKNLLTNFVNDSSGPKYVVCPSELRVMPNGEVSKNERYLQNRQDMHDRLAMYISKLSMKLHNGVPSADDVKFPVHSILTGRRNNPPEKGVRPLSVYGPLHYMDLPELFMEYISSMTGKSPSTTGAGLEGAMTKGPFNPVSFVYDLNNAILSFILCGYHGFLSSAGYVGPQFFVGHDITYILPEIWSRMAVNERDPQFLIEHGYLEKCEDFKHNGKEVMFGRMGYRITKKFTKIFAGRVLSAPDVLFGDEILHPEDQDLDIFVDSMSNIIDSHRNAAELIISNADFANAIPPLEALLHIMHGGNYNGMTLSSEDFRVQFRRDHVINSDWYEARLVNKQKYDEEHLKFGIKYIENFLKKNDQVKIRRQLDGLNDELCAVKSSTYVDKLRGTIGR